MRHGLTCAVAALVILAPSPAEACGGFFCSRAPIVQARESVVYSYEDDGTLTMAVQINYQGRDEDFAWILPVPVPPGSIEVGTDELFTQLRSATDPIFTIQERVEGTCDSEPRCSYPSYGGGCSFGCAASAAPTFGADGGSFAAYDAGSVTVYSESTVGPYDTVVIGAATSAEVVTWLRDNSYDIPEATEPLLTPYAAQGFVFVALRLNANRDSSVIRPVVLSMATDEACLPIRLTPIASTPNLPIALYFLADRQATSTNYAYADIALSPDLFMGRTTWDAAVAARAVELGGRAFATDFAGGTPTLSLELPDVTDLIGEPAVQLVSELQQRGYQATGLLLEILERYIDPPSGGNSQSFINCLASGSSSCGTPARYDSERLIGAIEAEITAPRRSAQAMVSRHAYLTRLSTSMRPEDMTVDPVFALDDGLTDQPVVREATRVTMCSPGYFASTAPTRLEIDGESFPLSDGRTIGREDFCTERGGALMGDDSGGCASTTGRSAPLFSLFVVVGAIVFRLGRRRRR